MPISAALGSSALLPAGLGFRNKIMNGDMRLAQRGSTANGLTSSDACQTCDRWRFNLSGAGTWNLTREPDAPSGFYYSYKIYCASGAGTVTGSNYVQFEQRFEGQDLLDLGYGSSSPKPLTFSFWIKGNVTGTYIARLYSGTTSSGARSIHSTFTLNQVGVWEYKTVTFVGDSIGVRPVDENEGLRLTFWLAAGTDFRTGSPSTSWSTHVSGAVAGNVNLASATGNYVQFTGLQLEQNYQPTPFEQRPFGLELSLCQRYYCKNFPIATAPSDGQSILNSDLPYFHAYITNALRTTWIKFPVVMRTEPNTFWFYRTDYTATNGRWGIYPGGWVSTGAVAAVEASSNGFQVETTATATAYMSYLGAGYWAASAEL